MESYSFDLLWISTEDRTKIVFFLAERLYQNKFMERDEDGYEFTLLADGQENPLDENLDYVYTSILEEAAQIASEKIAARLERERLEQIAARQKAAEEERARDLKTLNYLTKKLNGEPLA